MYYFTLYSSFKFCRTEFSIYHPLHGRHFLTHHLGDCLRLLETLQKVPALLSLYSLSLISLKQATINLSSSHCTREKSLCASNVRRPKFHRSDEKQRAKQLIKLERTHLLHIQVSVCALNVYDIAFDILITVRYVANKNTLLFYLQKKTTACQTEQAKFSRAE